MARKSYCVLPVTTISIQNDNPDISSEKVAKVANAVLNAETTGINNMIIGTVVFQRKEDRFREEIRDGEAYVVKSEFRNYLSLSRWSIKEFVQKQLKGFL